MSDQREITQQVLAKIIQSIAALQPKYSSSNTEDMAKRGKLIRQDLPNALREHSKVFEAALGTHGSDIGFKGSDGIGRKTQAPWVRIYSTELSPKPTIGFYMVVHFSTDGLKCFVTVGCSATRWDSEKGDLVRSSDKNIQEKINWLFSVLDAEGVDYSSFTDKIDIGSKDPLPKLFEQATALCQTFSTSRITETDLVSSISEALGHLSRIYDAQGQLSDLPQSQIVKIEIDSIVNPTRKNAASRQGYGLSAPEKKAVENRAMHLTRAYLEDLGYSVKDMSAHHSYDFLAIKKSNQIKVEVKGTTSSIADSILMTANEVTLHSSEEGTTALAIVSNVRFTERGVNSKCVGGVVEFMYPWNVSQWEAVPTAFIVKRPKKTHD